MKFRTARCTMGVRNGFIQSYPLLPRYSRYSKATGEEEIIIIVAFKQRPRSFLCVCARAIIILTDDRTSSFFENVLHLSLVAFSTAAVTGTKYSACVYSQRKPTSYNCKNDHVLVYVRALYASSTTVSVRERERGKKVVVNHLDAKTGKRFLRILPFYGSFFVVKRCTICENEKSLLFFFFSSLVFQELALIIYERCFYFLHPLCLFSCRPSSTSSVYLLLFFFYYRTQGMDLSW